MKRTSLGDVCFAVADGWSCASVVLNADDPTGDFSANVVLTRDAAQPEQTPAQYAHQMLQRVRSAKMGATLASRGDFEFDSGRVGAVLELVTESPVGPIRQMQVIDIDAQRRVIVFTASELDGPPFERRRAAFVAMARSIAASAAPGRR